MVTAYTVERHKPRSHQRTPASGHRVRKGVVALSRDLEHTLDVAFGDWVVLEGMGTFVFEDRTAARCRRRVDLFIESQQAARQFGVKATYVRAHSALASIQEGVVLYKQCCCILCQWMAWDEVHGNPLD